MKVENLSFQDAVIHLSQKAGIELPTLRRNIPVSYTHLRAHETPEHLVCRLLLEKKKKLKLE
mgnify:CR=1 FL=1